MLRSLGAVLLAALLGVASARAETGQARFVVGVIVPARATLTPVDAPTRITVSTADIARGYRDVSARYEVTSNGPRGWLLSLSPRLGITSRIEVRGLSNVVVLQRETVEVYRPVAGPAEPLQLDYRIVLAPGAAPGSYELPVHVAVTPL